MNTHYYTKIEKIKEALRQADLVLIGAGAGLSTAAGLEYDGTRFEANFKDFITKYGLSDMYSSGFYPFASEEEQWAYWSRHVKLNRFDALENRVYPSLLELVKDKEYFVITTNADGLFERHGFDTNKLFVVQGDYAKFQCAKPCHDTLYDNRLQIETMLKRQKECKIPSELIPKCPKCAGKMEMNLRKDERFVQDALWDEQYDAYKAFVENLGEQNIVLLELGVGYNTPSIIKYPFEHIASTHNRATLVRMNKNHDEVSLVNKNRTIALGECISEVMEDLMICTLEKSV